LGPVSIPHFYIGGLAVVDTVGEKQFLGWPAGNMYTAKKDNQNEDVTHFFHVLVSLSGYIRFISLFLYRVTGDPFVF